MKVTNTPPSELIKAYQSHASNGVEPTRHEARAGTSTPLRDTVRMSEKAALFQDIQKGVASASEVRPDKVQEAQRQLQAGNYQADYTQVADKLIHPDLSARI